MSSTESNRSSLKSLLGLMGVGVGAGMLIAGVSGMGVLGHLLGIPVVVFGLWIAAERDRCPQCGHIHIHFGTVKHCQQCGCKLCAEEQEAPATVLLETATSGSRSGTAEQESEGTQPFDGLSASSSRHVDAAPDSVDDLVAEWDFGRDLSQTLVIREVRWPRVVGMLICLTIGGLFLLPVLFAEGRKDHLASLLALAAASTFLLGCAVLLFSQLLQAGSFYVAVTNECLYRRRGARKLVRVPLREIRRLERHRGVLRVVHGSPPRTTNLLKDAYAPERLATIIQRLSAWLESPPHERPARMHAVDVEDFRSRRHLGNRLIVTGLATACVLPLLIAWKAPGARGLEAIAILLWGVGTLMALGQVIAGVLIRCGAQRKRQFSAPVED